MKTFTQKLSVAMLLCASLSGVTTMSYAETTNPNAPVSMVSTWDKTFAESDKVDHRKVSFQNRYGITLVGDLYLPKTAATASWRRLRSAGHLARSKSSPAACMRKPWQKMGL
jgi:hypothetical protein